MVRVLVDKKSERECYEKKKEEKTSQIRIFQLNEKFWKRFKSNNVKFHCTINISISLLISWFKCQWLIHTITYKYNYHKLLYNIFLYNFRIVLCYSFDFYLRKMSILEFLAKSVWKKVRGIVLIDCLSDHSTKYLRN